MERPKHQGPWTGYESETLVPTANECLEKIENALPSSVNVEQLLGPIEEVARRFETISLAAKGEFAGAGSESVR